MNILIGPIWAWFFLIVGAIAFVIGIIWLIASLANRETPVWGILVLILGILFLFQGSYSKTHVIVPVNHKALIVDTLTGDVIGKPLSAGVQKKPAFRVNVMFWPQNQAYKHTLDLAPGTSSASSLDRIALYVDSTVWIDLSGLEIERAYYAVNGGWDKFLAEYLEPQMMGLVRETSKGFTVFEHQDSKPLWVEAFDKKNAEFFSTEAGFGVQILEERTIMSFDFVNSADAEAFDNASRSVALVRQRENELKAAEIEVQIAEKRAEILLKNSEGSTLAFEPILEYYRSLSEDEKAFMPEIMDHLETLEALRIAGDKDSDVPFFPSFAFPMYGVNAEETQVPESVPQE